MSNLPSPEDLMRRACEVRDEDQAQANTAQRVGALLADLVTTVSSALPLTSWRVSRTAEMLSVEYTVVAADGTIVKPVVELPAATTDQAGVMTAADKQAVNNMPRPQDTASATAAARRYVYSVNDPQAKNSVLNAPDTLIRQAGGELRFQKGLWNPLGQAIYYTANRVPVATAGADGAMSKEVFARLGAGGTLREGTPTTLKVPIVYPNWADGGTRTFDLLPATSARAGMMTAADKAKLDLVGNRMNLIVRHAYFSTGSKTIGITDIDGNSTSDEIAAVFGNNTDMIYEIFEKVAAGAQVSFLWHPDETESLRLVSPVQVSLEKVVTGAGTIYHIDLLLPDAAKAGLRVLNLGYNETQGTYIVY